MADETPPIDGLDALAGAKSPGELIAAHRDVLKSVKARRRDKHIGILARTFRAAMEIWDAQKAEGLPVADRHAALEASLRQAWPKPRTEPWHYLCDACSDTGWRVLVCGDGLTCGRPFRLPGQRSDDWTGRGKCVAGHTFAQACYCEKGRERQKQALAPASQDFTQATKGKKPSGFSRFGR